MNITVLIVDDQALIRSAIRALLQGEEDIEVIGEASDGAQAVREAHHLQPDVILMDIRMPVLDGIGATQQICDDPDLAATRVLVFTTFEQDDYVLSALRAGASGFIGKGLDPVELAAAIRTIHTGEALLSPVATRALVDRIVSAPDSPPASPSHRGLDNLTEREREVLVLVASGLSNDDIARSLIISTSTAKTHVNRTMAKLWAHDRAQLVIIAYENGLISPGDK